ncbi:hypothetical protein JW935_20270 [candidate division KSB1 bacterium]|nr:hypothetical protein [candidate division KSB1 bacterium]
MEKNPIHQLAEAVNKVIQLLHKVNQEKTELLDEKKKLLNLLAEKNLKIEGLKKLIVELKENPNDKELQQYKENEKKLKNKIKLLLVKLDELQKL